MKKQLHVAVSPLTNTIYAGHILKDGLTWGANKQDITNDAVIAVAQHALKFKERTGKDIVLKGRGVPSVRIAVSYEPEDTDNANG